MKINTFDTRKKKEVFVGTLVEKTFTRKVTQAHYMKKEQGYGIQEDVLIKLETLKCENIVIDTGFHIYTTALADWKALPTKDCDGGPQKFYPIKKIRNVTMKLGESINLT